MGFQMSKPHLRAELEADLKRYDLHLRIISMHLLALYHYVLCDRICNGEKRKEGLDMSRALCVLS